MPMFKVTLALFIASLQLCLCQNNHNKKIEFTIVNSKLLKVHVPLPKNGGSEILAFRGNVAAKEQFGEKVVIKGEDMFVSTDDVQLQMNDAIQYFILVWNGEDYESIKGTHRINQIPRRTRRFSVGPFDLHNLFPGKPAEPHYRDGFYPDRPSKFWRRNHFNKFKGGWRRRNQQPPQPHFDYDYNDSDEFYPPRPITNNTEKPLVTEGVTTVKPTQSTVPDIDIRYGDDTIRFID